MSRILTSVRPCAALTAAAVALLLVCATAAHAQLTTATVTGTVHDTSGGAIPGATVTLTGKSRGTTIDVVTAENGAFVFWSGAAIFRRRWTTLDGSTT